MDISVQNIKVLNDREVSIIENKDEDYIFSALTVSGGVAIKKGLSIGYQERMVPGLLIYDDENFYGFSEKYGLSLLSNHTEYNELKLPSNIFENREERTIQPTPKNSTEHFKNLKDTEKEEYKNLNIDLQLKDSNNFCIIIPNDYNSTKFILMFNLKYIFDLNSIIYNIAFTIINESNKSLFFKIDNPNCYYEKNYNNEIIANSTTKIKFEVINNKYYIISTSIYYPKSS